MARRRWWALALLVLATVVAYQPAWHGGLLWDDDAHLTRVELRDVGGLFRIWTDVTATPQYYPLVHTAFWVMFRMWGTDTFGYHLATLFLHAASACLVALVLWRLKVPGAALAATVFALHPVHVESVAWMSELKNTLSGVFYLGAALLYLRFDESRNRRLYALALLSFAAALLSKSVTGSLPAALLVVLWWRRGSLRWREDVSPLVPFFAMGIATGLLTVWLERMHVGARGEDFDFTLIERTLIAGRAVWFYAAKLVWPADLTFTYPRWAISTQVWWQYLFPLSLLAAAVTFWTIRHRTRAPLAALLFFVGTLFPALGFVNVFPFRYSFVADHFQYLASLGVIVPLCAALSLALQQRASTAALRTAVVTVGGMLAALTWHQSRQYVSAETLYRTTLDRNPESFMAHNNLGAILVHGSDQDVSRAVDHLTEAVRIYPKGAETHTNLGLAYERQGRLTEAIAAHRKAIVLNPRLPEAHYNLASALAAAGRHVEALASFEQALRINPRSAEARHNAANSLVALGRNDEALLQLQAARDIAPGSVRIHRALADTLQRLRRYDEAVAEYQAALRLQPGSAETYYNYALALQASGRVAEAVASYRAAAERAPAYGVFWDALGAALVSAGRPDEALLEYQRGLTHTSGVEAATIHHAVGRLYAMQGRRQEALLHLQRALDLDPGRTAAREDLARVRIMAGGRVAGSGS